MMKIIFSFFLLLSFTAFAEEEHQEKHHDHNVKVEAPKEDPGHSHEHEEEHEEKSNEDGFKLGPAGMKTFEIKLLKVTTAQVNIQKAAIYKGLNEVNLYRLREGHFKRIDFKTISKTPDGLLVSSPDLKNGDEIVIQGVGFLRMAEIAATGGLSDFHSH